MTAKTTKTPVQLGSELSMYMSKGTKCKVEGTAHNEDDSDEIEARCGVWREKSWAEMMPLHRRAAEVTKQI